MSTAVQVAGRIGNAVRKIEGIYVPRNGRGLIQLPFDHPFKVWVKSTGDGTADYAVCEIHPDVVTDPVALAGRVWVSDEDGFEIEALDWTEITSGGFICLKIIYGPDSIIELEKVDSVVTTELDAGSVVQRIPIAYIQLSGGAVHVCQLQFGDINTLFWHISFDATKDQVMAHGASDGNTPDWNDIGNGLEIASSVVGVKVGNGVEIDGVDAIAVKLNDTLPLPYVPTRRVYLDGTKLMGEDGSVKLHLSADGLGFTAEAVVTVPGENPYEIVDLGTLAPSFDVGDGLEFVAGALPDDPQILRVLISGDASGLEFVLGSLAVKPGDGILIDVSGGVGIHLDTTEVDLAPQLRIATGKLQVRAKKVTLALGESGLVAVASDTYGAWDTGIDVGEFVCP